MGKDDELSFEILKTLAYSTRFERMTVSSEACAFAVMLVASVEGAVVLSRAEKSVEPFETVARQLTTLARALPTV